LPTIKQVKEYELRELKGLAIAAKGAQIKRINKLSYNVRSQSNGLWYSVVEEYGSSIERIKKHWTCSCPDHLYRGVQCKHIYAVLFSKQLRKKIVGDQDVPGRVIPDLDSELKCPRCHAAEIEYLPNGKIKKQIVKREVRHTKYGIDVQRYWCKVCNYRFSHDSLFERTRANPKAITAALDLLFRGVSTRGVSDHLKRHYGIKVTHVAVLKWRGKFVKIVKPFVDQMEPAALSGIFHVDEMMVHVRKEKTDKGHYAWLWNLMDNATRYWICSMISRKREIEDARAVFNYAKETTGIKPKAIVHDGLPAYEKAFDKEFFTLKNPRTLNIRSVSVRHEGLNSKLERLNGTVRDREVTKRGMDHIESAQESMDAERIFYNFFRPHQALDGKTPAEASGIIVEGDNKWVTLIKNAKKERIN